MHLTIATAGHIDHGKSTLVQALTGINPDRLKEEQARGISIELGFAHTRVGDTTLSFVDVPGHERFVRTMLAGIGGIDAVLLVVAADESVMPQTREHLAICRLLDVPAGVVALSRCDLADETMRTVAADDVRDLLAGTPLAEAPIVPVSARTGEGLDALRAALVACTPRARERDAPARLPIDRVFTVKGFGTVVTGTLWSGTIAADHPLRLEPAGRDVRVRGVQVHGAAVTVAGPGQRAAVNLAGVAVDDVQRGDVLVGPGAVLVSRRLAVHVTMLDDAAALQHGARIHVHLGTAAAIGRVILPLASTTQARRRLEPGQRGLALLRLEAPLPVRRGDRLVLRSYSPVTTVGGALVVDPLPSARASALTALVDITDADAATWLQARLDEAGTLGVPDDDVAPRCGLAPAEARAVVGGLRATGLAVSIAGVWIATAHLEAIRARLLEAIDQAQATDPIAGGIPRATLRTLRARRWRPEVVDHVLARLIEEGVVTGDERLSRAAVAPAARDEADARVLDALASAGLRGLTLGDLEASMAGLDRKALSAVLGRLTKSRDVERVGDLYVAAGPMRDLVADLRATVGGQASALFDVGWFKERYGLTRRTAIPLLEWLDRARVTRRQGDARVVVGEP